MSLLKSRKFKQTLIALLRKGENSLRLKAHEILEILASYHTNYLVSKSQVEVFTGSFNSYSTENLR